jgi:uncharacterized damage-inducible protein DinB
METYIKKLSEYNIWANGLVSDCIRKLSEDQWLSTFYTNRL